MEKIMNMTLQEIIDDGGSVNIYYFSLDNKEIAKEKIGRYEDIAHVEEQESDGMHWLKINGGSVDVATFYESTEEPDTEHAQAELTEQKRGKSLYEQKLEESGHKESDFA